MKSWPAMHYSLVCIAMRVEVNTACYVFDLVKGRTSKKPSLRATCIILASYLGGGTAGEMGPTMLYLDRCSTCCIAVTLL